MSAGPKDEKVIFAAAAALRTPAERQAYLDAACGSDTALRARLAALLGARQDQNDFLDQFLSTAETALRDSEEALGTVIDRYKLLEKIGEGGMAVVYMAEQTEPIRRKVALKIIKLGMDTRQVIARFEAERQALALLDHPNIAKVFDAGATETGRPYFVMELVRGLTITAYCDQNRLNTRQRLGLLIQVCHAVQHAHQKGIIHRDLKPSNVMVTMHDDKPVPKVIDFGIAKATNQRLTEKTLFTCYAHMIGTPAYMSPEQARMSGLDVDTRTDIYSLGVLLYELLTGTTPFAPETLQQAGYAEIERIIRETDPPTPSTRLRNLGQDLLNVAQWRHTSGEVLQKLIRGDLDCIVMKCLEKGRTRRYASAHELTTDIQRHLRHEPILARAPGIVYRLRKFTRRNRTRIAVAGVAAMLLLGILSMAWMYRSSRRAERVQWAKGQALPQVVEFVKEGNYRVAFPLAQQVRKYIPEDPVLVELWPRICQKFSVTTTPAGAKVSYRQYNATDAQWQYLGQSPLEGVPLARGAYRWKIEKGGFATHECVAESSFDVRLREAGSAHDMVWIQGTTFRPQSQSSGQDVAVRAPAYLIDKYEVTNEQFQEFVDAGGYENPDYWKGLTFLKEGNELSRDEAVSEFVDKTGQSGPSTWERGTYAEGQGKRPVGGVSWFEAVAYSRFAGKSLPTLYHWNHAACLDASIVIVPQSNFAVGGIAAVGSWPGMGRTGLYDMAGNVKEWCFNATDHSGNRRYILGGGCGEQTYMFGVQDFRSPWDRAAVHGFRCMKNSGGRESVADVLLEPVPLPPATRDYSTLKPCSDDEYRLILQQFDYDRTPLDPVVESVDESPPFWRHEKITFNAAYGDERMIGHLFLPKAVEPPYQVVVYWPGSGALDKRSFDGLDERDYTEIVIMSGRALMFPIYKGSYERGTGQLPDWDNEPHAVTDWIIKDCKDMRRSLDYLETRDDVDADRIAYYGMSAGGGFGPMALAVEDRFKAGILIVGGFPTDGVGPAKNTIDPLHHAPRVKTPVLMINGKEDFVFPYETSQRPLYESLGTAKEHKKHKVYPGGHGLPSLFSRQIREDVLAWLDRYLGPVNGERNDNTK